jgi:Rrf2 family protein
LADSTFRIKLDGKISGYLLSEYADAQMRMTEGVEWAVHTCTVLALLPHDSALPASRLAEFHGVPPAYLAKHLQAMARAGIVTSGTGRRGGYRLARAASKITLLEVVDAVDGAEPAFQCNEIRQRGPAALGPSSYSRTCGIARAMARAELAYRKELAATTVADLVVGLARDVPVQAAVKAAKWFQETQR